MNNSKIGLVLKGYPRLSETFIAQEILELERNGFDLDIISLRRPYDGAIHPVHEEISAPVHYLPEYLHEEPLRVLKGWWAARKLPGYGKALDQFIRDFRRDRTRNRVRRFGQALVMAREFSDFGLYYVHFLHTPASASRYASMMTGIPFAISAHAKDIWTSPDWEIAEKLADCEWCVTCTRGGAEKLAALERRQGTVQLVYHGLDFSRFPTFDRRHSPSDGSAEKAPVALVTVGRAVEKKGIDTLLQALAKLPDRLHWHWTHIGGGELHEALITLAKDLGIADRCSFLGKQAQAKVIECYQSSDLFVLPCRISKSGDRDGLPNVMVEAQSQELAVLTTGISGIPELIEPGVNGIFVEPDNAEQLAEALEDLIRNPDKRERLGKAGEAIVRQKFDHRSTIGRLADLLKSSLKSRRDTNDRATA